MVDLNVVTDFLLDLRVFSFARLLVFFADAPVQELMNHADNEVGRFLDLLPQIGLPFFSQIIHAAFMPAVVEHPNQTLRRWNGDTSMNAVGQDAIEHMC